MKNEQYMTQADWIELREIEATTADAKARKARLFNRLRQRAFKARLAENSKAPVQLNEGAMVQ